MEKLHEVEPNYFAWHCPGCGCAHMVPVNGARTQSGSSWGWNGSKVNPTFTPSVLCRSTILTELGQAQYDKWSKGEADLPEKLDSKPVVCHSFVVNGKMQFLGDCTHELAGKVVDIPAWE